VKYFSSAKERTMARNQVYHPANPYIAGAPIKGERMFFGRNDIFEAARARLVGQHQNPHWTTREF
jgi:hypothetical protein